MKVYRNTTEIAAKDKRGRNMSMLGLGILFIGLLASFIPSWFPLGTTPSNPIFVFLQQYWTIISFAALPLGFLAASFGSYYVTRYARRRWAGTNVIARPDEMVERGLKGLDDKYSLFIFSLPVAYVLLTPFSIMTLAVRSDKGKVRVEGDKWKEGWGMGRLLTIFSREGVGHPPSELDDQTKKIQTYLANVPAPSDDPVLIEGAVLFINSETLLEMSNPSVPVVRVDQFKDYLRKRSKETKANPAVMRAVADYMQTHNRAIEAEGDATEAPAKA